MLHILVLISRILLVFLFAVYTYGCFSALKSGVDADRADAIYMRQTSIMYLILVIANLILFLSSKNGQIIMMTLIEMVFFIGIDLIYKHIYRGASQSLVNNMCMLLAISFIILTRLDITKAYKQLIFAVAALVITCLIPFFVQKMKFLDKLTWVYAIVGILGLGAVALGGSTVYGAKLNISVGGIAIQPSEFIKILFVFFVASMLYRSTEKRNLVITTAVAMLHVLIMVASRDLGGAGIFLLTYLVMFYVATRKPIYLLAGIGMTGAGAVAAYFLFHHVRVRVIAWLDPLSVANNEGYQICQSLFAIGTGGWFGSGLYEGMPEKIPVVAQDFVFSAISEEMGGIFALCLIFVCISCFLMFFNIAMQIRDRFYKLVALGLGTAYSTQVFLTLGGVTKFIPSTGVTLPLVSYGGSSLLATMILFAVVQGLYVLREEQEEVYEKQHPGRRDRQ